MHSERYPLLQWWANFYTYRRYSLTFPPLKRHEKNTQKTLTEHGERVSECVRERMREILVLRSSHSEWQEHSVRLIYWKANIGRLSHSYKCTIKKIRKSTFFLIQVTSTLTAIVLIGLRKVFIYFPFVNQAWVNTTGGYFNTGRRFKHMLNEPGGWGFKSRQA